MSSASCGGYQPARRPRHSFLSFLSILFCSLQLPFLSSLISEFPTIQAHVQAQPGSVSCWVVERAPAQLSRCDVRPESRCSSRGHGTSLCEVSASLQAFQSLKTRLEAHDAQDLGRLLGGSHAHRFGGGDRGFTRLIHEIRRIHSSATQCFHWSFPAFSNGSSAWLICMGKEA